MNAQPHVRFVTGVLCDDVRREISGKEILIGVYSGTLNLQEIPAMMLVGVAVFFDTPEAGDVPIEIRLRGVDGGLQSGLKVAFNIPAPTEPHDTQMFTLAGLPLKIENEGKVAIVVRQHDEEWQVLKIIQVKKNSALPEVAPVPIFSAPTASPPPS